MLKTNNVTQRLTRDIILGLLVLVALTGCKQSPTPNAPQELGKQFAVLLRQADADGVQEKQKGGKKLFPRSLAENGQVNYVQSGDWCSGFFAGCLWMLADYTNDSTWKAPAIKYTNMLAEEQWNDGTHDMGFKMMGSFGHALKQTGDRRYADVLVQSAKTLITRYNDTVGCIRSWDFNADTWSFPVIIDNMMNLELLFEATKMTGDSTFYHIAVRHADTTSKNHFRADHSSYHVVDYDPVTGAVHLKITHQGNADESSWARGQAWGLYGYTMCYRYTQNPAYLEQAEQIAAYIFSHPNLPTDQIPMWDFDYTEQSAEPRDVSAATVIASALYELSGFSPEHTSQYRQWADGILTTLQNGYSLHNGQKWGFLLDHSVGFKRRNQEVDVPIIYADYYYLEALLRQRELHKQGY